MSDGAFLNLRQTATPNGNAQTGGVLFYFKSDGKAYTKINGVEALLADVTQSGTQTLTNKTIALGSNTISGTTAQFNTALTDNDFATLAGAETLTNKTVNLSSNTLSGTTAQFNTALSDNDFATLAGTETLTNKTLSTGTKVGAATNDISGAWTSFTPTWTGLTIGNATVDAKYMQIGKTVHFFISATMGSTTTFSGAFTATLPVTARIGAEYRFPIGMKDVSAGNNYFGTTFNHSTTVMNLAMTGGANGLLPGTLGPTGPFTWAVSDLLTISGTYEAA